MWIDSVTTHVSHTALQYLAPLKFLKSSSTTLPITPLFLSFGKLHTGFHHLKKPCISCHIHVCNSAQPHKNQIPRPIKVSLQKRELSSSQSGKENIERIPTHKEEVMVSQSTSKKKMNGNENKKKMNGNENKNSPSKGNGLEGSALWTKIDIVAGGIMNKNKKNLTPQWLLKHALDMCSKKGDLKCGIELYDMVVIDGRIRLLQDHYNVLLYLCSSAAMGTLIPRKSGTQKVDKWVARENKEEVIIVDKDTMEMALNKGFEIYQYMQSQGVAPNEATFTSMARLAAAKQDGDMAFEVVKQMSSHGIVPKLRSYDPALQIFFSKKEVGKAFELDEHMLAMGVQPEEPELRVLLQLSVEAGREEKVYDLLHRLRSTVRQVSEASAAVIEKWFRSNVAAKHGLKDWNAEEIRKATAARGGGWHGQGWLNHGNWNVAYTTVNSNGVCRCCKERLVTIDLDPAETERFAESIASLAEQRVNKESFSSFKRWLACNGPYEAVVDGANIGFHQKVSGDDNFTFSQLSAVVNGLKRRSPSNKWPLIVLHNARTRVGPARKPEIKQLISKWEDAKSLYSTPTGSNDDWYWLYAAVKFKCLLITNDEMRDHIFALLGNDFFPKWKERHQVRYSFSRNGVSFHMPPPYSIVIQESESGSWHIPMIGDDIEMPRKWLCITRGMEIEPANLKSASKLSISETETEINSKNVGAIATMEVRSRKSLRQAPKMKVPHISLDKKNSKVKENEMPGYN